jgi:hypothetical protein
MRTVVLCTAALAAMSLAIPVAARRADGKPVNVQIEMRNVRLHADEGVVIDIARLRGTMTPRVPGKPPVFDDQRSFTIDVDAADMSMDMASVTSLMNAHVFAYQGAPLTNLSVRATDDGRLEMKGTLHKGLSVPFSSKASVAPAGAAGMRVHIESMKAVGVPAKGLLALFGLELDDLVDLKNRRGVEIQDNDIVMQPGQVMPPPELRGTLSKAAVSGGRLVLAYASDRHTAPLTLPDPHAKNYIYFGGGQITFGKLTMSDADLQLIDENPKDPFDFYPAKYNAQLVAGYSKNTPRKGLKTYMPDYGRVANRTGK